MNITNKAEYKHVVNSISENIAYDFKEDESQEITDLIHESIVGSEYIIYTKHHHTIMQFGSYNAFSDIERQR